jgi:DNA polymerase III epsilon subunit-like protein
MLDPAVVEVNARILGPVTPGSVIVDLETTSLKASDGLIWQIAILPLKFNGNTLMDNALGEPLTFVLQLPPEQLVNMDYAIRTRAKARKDCTEDEAILQTEAQLFAAIAAGIPQVEGLQIARDVICAAAASGGKIIGHNLWAFDWPWLETQWQRYGIAYTPPPDSAFIDTALLVKAAQYGRYTSPDEPRREFWNSVKHTILPGVKYSLDWCTRNLELQRKYGMSTEGAHDALFDTMLTYCVLREMVV